MRGAHLLLVGLAACTPSARAPDASPTLERFPVPCLRVVPEALDFGEVEHDQTGAARLRVTNTTNYDLDLGSQPLPGAFTVSPAIDRQSVHLAPGATRELAVTFFSIDGSLHLSTLELDATHGCTASIALSALGSGSLTLSPATLDFGFVAPGAEKTLTVTLTNSRRAPLTVRSLNITSRTAEAFGAPLPPELTLAPSSSQTYTVTAVPPTDDTFLGELQAVSSLGPVRSSLRVIGGAPVAEFSTSSFEVPVVGLLGFGERVLTLRNASTVGRSGEARLRLVSPFFRVEALEGAPEELEVAPSAPAIVGLGLGEATEVTFALLPTATGPHRYRVTFVTNDPAQPEHVVTFATQVELLPRCVLDVRPSGSLALTATSSGRSEGTVTLENLGPNRCVVDDVRITDAAHSPFTVAGEAQVMIAPGSTQVLTVSATRSQVATTGELGFHVFNAGGARQVVVLVAPP